MYSIFFYAVPSTIMKASNTESHLKPWEAEEAVHASARHSSLITSADPVNVKVAAALVSFTTLLNQARLLKLLLVKPSVHVA